jgi:hypothetical protein
MSWLRMVVVAKVVLAGTLFAVGADSAAVALTLGRWARCCGGCEQFKDPGCAWHHRTSTSAHQL